MEEDPLSIDVYVAPMRPYTSPDQLGEGVRVGVLTTRLSGVPESASRGSAISLIQASGIMPV